MILFISFNDSWNLCHQYFITISLLWHKRQILLAYLTTTYWYTWFIQLYKHRNLKGSGTWSVLLGSQRISECIKSIFIKNIFFIIIIYVSRLFFMKLCSSETVQDKDRFIKCLSIIHLSFSLYNLWNDTKNTKKAKLN